MDEIDEVEVDEVKEFQDLQEADIEGNNEKLVELLSLRWDVF